MVGGGRWGENLDARCEHLLALHEQGAAGGNVVCIRSEAIAVVEVRRGKRKRNAWLDCCESFTPPPLDLYARSEPAKHESKER